jgi:hypothetical protein
MNHEILPVNQANARFFRKMVHVNGKFGKIPGFPGLFVLCAMFPYASHHCEYGRAKVKHSNMEFMTPATRRISHHWLCNEFSQDDGLLPWIVGWVRFLVSFGIRIPYVILYDVVFAECPSIHVHSRNEEYHDMYIYDSRHQFPPPS